MASERKPQVTTPAGLRRADKVMEKLRLKREAKASERKRFELDVKLGEDEGVYWEHGSVSRATLVTDDALGLQLRFPRGLSKEQKKAISKVRRVRLIIELPEET